MPFFGSRNTAALLLSFFLLQTACASRNWMRDFHGRTLLQLVLPATHDSAAYSTCASCPENRRPENALIRPWSETQKLNIRQQLDLGVRYLDVRVRLSGNVVYTSHFLLMVPLRTVLLDILAFCRANPTEVVVVKLRENRGNVPVSRLVAELKATVESLAVPAGLHGATLGEMLAEGQIVFLADEEYSDRLPFEGAPYVASGDAALRKWWPNVQHFTRLCEALKERTSSQGFFEEGTVAVGKVNVVKCSVTVTPVSLVGTLRTHSNFESMGAAVNKDVVVPFLDSIAGVRGNIGIAIETDFVTAEIVQKTIAMNRPRVGSVSPLKCGGLLCANSGHCGSETPVCDTSSQTCVRGQLKGEEELCSSSRECATGCCSFVVFGSDRCRERAPFRTCRG